MNENERVLTSVEADLERGLTHVALQRLGDLFRQNPGDVQVRARMGAIRMATGNLVEAGRWSFFDPDVDPVALAAFEHAFPDPVFRLRALRLPRSGEIQAGPEGMARLLELREAAAAQGQVDRHGEPPFAGAGSRDVGFYLWCALGALVTLDLLAVIVVGNVALVRWLT